MGAKWELLTFLLFFRVKSKVIAHDAIDLVFYFVVEEIDFAHAHLSNFISLNNDLNQ